MKNLKKIAAFTAAAAFAAALAGCSAGSCAARESETLTPPPAASAAADTAETAGDGTTHLSQTETVAGESYAAKEKYADFLAAAKKAFLIPGLAEGAVPQGMCRSKTDGRLYLSAYFTADLPSVLMAMDETGTLRAVYTLYNSDGSAFNSHVGGVAVTDTTVYISAKLDNDGQYSIAAIPRSELNSEGNQKVTIKTLYTLPISPSFLSVSDDTLWVGNFYHPEKDYDLSPEMNFTTHTADGDYGCYILGYALGQGEAARMTPAAGAAYPVPDYVLAAPDRIQGVQLVGDTVVLSQSYGRGNDSTLYGYQLDLSGTPDTTVAVGNAQVPCWLLDTARQRWQMTAMPMTEALTAAPDGGVYVLFESGALSYSDGKSRTDHLWELALPQ